VEVEMGSSSTAPPLDRTSVRRMLVVFGVLGIAGVVMLKFSVVIGLALLVVAEVFFAVAYRRFSRPPKPSG
jgi:hypothetical protein